MKADIDFSGAIPDSRGTNLYRADRDAAALFAHYLPRPLFRHLEPTFDRLGGLAGGHLDELAGIADHNPPTLSVRRRTGEDCNVVEKHPAYVEMERLAFSELGLAAMSHRGVLGWNEPMPPAAKYALTYLFVQAEFGLMCPVSMTDSLTRTLRRFGDPKLVGRYLERLTSVDFDELAQGAMFMTEQGAGSDVSATATRAALQPDGTWTLTGDKWFCSNADADLAMVLARSEDVPGMKGISLFLLPKVKADGRPNDYRILRLKDKLGTRSMASGEIRLDGAVLAGGATIAGAGHSDGGTVIFAEPPESGTRITLRRRLKIARATDFQDNGILRARSLNDELDYQVAAIQQVADDVHWCH